MSANGRKDLIADLVALKYDLALDLYRQRAVALAAEAGSRKGSFWEYSAYKVFGTDLISRIALWLDPCWQFQRNWKSKDANLVYLQTVVPANRTRTKLAIGMDNIIAVTKVTSSAYRTDAKWNGSGYSQGPWYKVSTANNPASRQNFGKQGGCYSFIKDTTWKSRNPGRSIPRNRNLQNMMGLQSQGELEIWQPSFYSKGFSIGYESVTRTYNQFSATITAETDTRTRTSIHFVGPAASVRDVDVAELPNLEKVHAMDICAKYAKSMVTSCLVTRRQFNLGYQIGELKDLPQTLRGTVAVLRDIEHLIGWKEFVKALSSQSWWSDRRVIQLTPLLEKLANGRRFDHTVSGAYLTFKFGYESMYQAVSRFLETPNRVAKDVNLLINRNGRFQTLSIRKRLPVEEWTAVPVIDMPVPYPMIIDPERPFQMKGERQVTLRCVVNSGVKLPVMVEPRLRKQMFYDKLGWPMRPSDLYNLIPWTWLGDWFVGVSEYIRLLESIHLDKSLINWGVMVYESKLKNTASQTIFDVTSHETYFTPGTFHTSVPEKHKLHETAVFEAKYKLRIDLASLADVKSVSGSGLTQTQGSIIGALLSQFT